MTSAEDAKIRNTLSELRRQLEAELATPDTSASSIVPDDAIGRLTRMEALQSQAVNSEGRRRLKARLQQVKAAVERLDKGTFGLCIRCKQSIPQGRLDFMPEAALCVECSSKSSR